jgi:hypothetical protein
MTLSNLASCSDTKEREDDEVTMKCAEDNLFYPALSTGDPPLAKLALFSVYLGMEQRRSGAHPQGRIRREILRG